MTLRYDAGQFSSSEMANERAVRVRRSDPIRYAVAADFLVWTMTAIDLANKPAMQQQATSMQRETAAHERSG